MQTLVRIALVSVLLIPAAPAVAGTFNLIARLTVRIVIFDTGYTSVGAASAVTSIGGGAAQIPAGLFPATFSGAVSPAQSGVNFFSVVGGGLPAGTLDAAAATNALPLQGTFNLFAGAVPAGGIAQSPIGAGGSATAMVLGVFDATLVAEPWQLGVHTITGTGLAAGTFMVTGFDLRTALGQGVVQFVAPHSATIPAIPLTIPSGSILQLVYVPVAEPGSLAVLSLAFLAVVSCGRRSPRARDS